MTVNAPSQRAPFATDETTDEPGAMSARIPIWMRLWHPPTTSARLERARRLLVIGAAIDTARTVRWLRQAHAPAVLRIPFGPLEWLGAPRLGLSSLALLWFAVLVCAALAARRSGRAMRGSTLLLAILYAWWAAEHYSYGEPSHGRTALVTALVAFALAPRARLRRDSAYVSGWPLQILAFSLAVLFLSATWAKLKIVGAGWWHGGATQAGIALWGPGWSQRFAAARPGAVNAMALTALVIETLVGAGLLMTRPRRVAAVTAVAFHVVVLVVMGIDFLPMAWCAAVLAASSQRERPDRTFDSRGGRADLQ